MDVDALRRILIAEEGCVPHAYKDSEGFLTIGVGHLVDKALGGRLDDDVIDHQLKNDIERVEKDLATFPWWADLDPIRQLALADMRFQLGPARFRHFKKMLNAIAVRNYEQAAKEILDSRYAKQVPNRAKKRANEIRTGVRSL